MYDKHLRWLISPFPPDSLARRIGKRLFRGLTLKQDFYGGVIFFDAVGQSWAFKGLRYEMLDAKLRDDLLTLSMGCQHFIDIGCNVGAMTLSVLLRNKNINAVCADPNSRAIALLKKSVRRNQLGHRVVINEAAVGDKNGHLHVHFAGKSSEMGYVSDSGKRVASLDFVGLINQYSAHKCLVKIDIEGFETTLLRRIGQIANLSNACFVIELHPLGYNDAGNPCECVNLLQRNGAIVKRLDGLELSKIAPHEFTQVVAQWNTDAKGNPVQK